MINSRQFIKHRFLIVLIAVIIICGILSLLSKSTVSLPADQVPTAGPNPITTLISQTPTFLQNEQLVALTPFSPDTTAATSTSSQPEWKPLPPIPDSYRGLITNGDRAAYKIALTFDVCQSEGDLAGYDTEIIRVLNDTQTPATFFLGGEWMRDHQSETLDLASNPLFELGNHSWSHPDFRTLSSDGIKQEILLTQQYMFNLLGYQTNLFRLPFGTYNEDTLNVIGENGLYTIQWDDVSGDPDPNIDAQRMTSWVLQQVQPGSIIIMHANRRGWHRAEALPAIIQTLRQQGYTL